MRSSPGSGSSHDRGRIAFGDYAEAWLESRADLKPKTRRQYQSLMRLHIMPTWRTVPLAKITFEDLTQWVARLSLAGLGPSGVRRPANDGEDEEDRDQDEERLALLLWKT